MPSQMKTQKISPPALKADQRQHRPRLIRTTTSHNPSSAYPTCRHIPSTEPLRSHPLAPGPSDPFHAATPRSPQAMGKTAFALILPARAGDITELANSVAPPEGKRSGALVRYGSLPNTRYPEGDKATALFLKLMQDGVQSRLDRARRSRWSGSAAGARWDQQMFLGGQKQTLRDVRTMSASTAGLPSSP